MSNDRFNETEMWMRRLEEIASGDLPALTEIVGQMPDKLFRTLHELGDKTIRTKLEAPGEARSARRGWKALPDRCYRPTEVTKRRWESLLAAIDRGGPLGSLPEFTFEDERQLPTTVRVFDSETWLVEFALWAEEGFPEDVRACELFTSWVFTEQLLFLTMDDEMQGRCTVPNRITTAIEARLQDGTHDSLPILEFTWWGYETRSTPTCSRDQGCCSTMISSELRARSSALKVVAVRPILYIMNNIMN